MNNDEMLKSLEDIIRLSLVKAREEANNYTGPNEYHLGVLMGKILALDELARTIVEIHEYAPD